MATRNSIIAAVQRSMVRRKPSPQLREAAKKTKWDIVKGDKVQVIGKHPERGKQGVVKVVLRYKDRVIVEGVNLGPKHVKGNPAVGLKSRVEQVERSIHYSKVNLVDPASGKPTRVYKKFLEDGTKVRVAKKSGAIIPKPDPPAKIPPPAFVSDKDTVDEDVWEITYDKYNM
ncbi:protein L24 [Seminavis robusta]|uniref:Protein L24 n=1 Tax=Seminavis robusta TaxID=568900 RepID=A0A9N8HN44_9STRA|nr:protein L24 [Seminavis robusta]|eukprot:Sro1177_g249450.1 protein L24 (172) ;mRNA; r:28251-28766